MTHVKNGMIILPAIFNQWPKHSFQPFPILVPRRNMNSHLVFLSVMVSRCWDSCSKKPKDPNSLFSLNNDVTPKIWLCLSDGTETPPGSITNPFLCTGFYAVTLWASAYFLTDQCSIKTLKPGISLRGQQPNWPYRLIYSLSPETLDCARDILGETTPTIVSREKKRFCMGYWSRIITGKLPLI